MPGVPLMQLSRGRVAARVRPDEGGVVDELRIDGRSVLARTPWADAVVATGTPAASEAEWVARWRGGWQLCFPTTGQPDPTAVPPQSFHGSASQAPWTLIDATDHALTLGWADDEGLRARRTWRLLDDGLEADTRAVNDGAAARIVAVAEHLILGGDVLEPLAGGMTLVLEVPAGTALAPLDYDGSPTGAAVPWPGDPADAWTTVGAHTPARVAALVGTGSTPGSAAAGDASRVTARGPHGRATVTWTGLPSALLWQELGASLGPPWGGAVFALGIEPTTTPHGAGTALGDGLVTLSAGGQLAWRAALTVHWAAA